jgi:hypothetical protein
MNEKLGLNGVLQLIKVQMAALQERLLGLI